MAEEGRAKGRFAAVRTKNLEANRVEISAKESAWFVARGGTEQSEECFLGKLFGVGRIRNATAEESVDRLFVALKQFRESLRGAL